MNIFVAKLGRNTTSDSLRELFEQYGEVSSAKVIMDRDTGNSKGFGFVEMDDDSEAQQSIDALNESQFEGSTIVVKKARPREDNGGGYNRGGGGGYNRGGGRY
ncbi:MAG: RNA-binding protein [Cyclobacteriaceae bacterium]|nr:RNA-binding protein [Cyclobacteriaceae bacterium HetDA_MAG_MS6]